MFKESVAAEFCLSSVIVFNATHTRARNVDVGSKRRTRVFSATPNAQLISYVFETHTAQLCTARPGAAMPPRALSLPPARPSVRLSVCLSVRVCLRMRVMTCVMTTNKETETRTLRERQRGTQTDRQTDAIARPRSAGVLYPGHCRLVKPRVQK